MSLIVKEVTDGNLLDLYISDYLNTAEVRGSHLLLLQVIDHPSTVNFIQDLQLEVDVVNNRDITYLLIQINILDSHGEDKFRSVVTSLVKNNDYVIGDISLYSVTQSSIVMSNLIEKWEA